VSDKAKVGRPSKYNEEIQKKADKYASVELYSKKIIEKVFQGAKIPIEIDVPNSVPTVAGLALELGISRETVYDWARKIPSFSDTLQKIKLKQEAFLVHHGLLGGYDGNYAKFLAINMTDYKDKVESTVEQKTIQINIDESDANL
jgi:hypothetical protein